MCDYYNINRVIQAQTWKRWTYLHIFVSEPLPQNPLKATKDLFPYANRRVDKRMSNTVLNHTMIGNMHLKLEVQNWGGHGQVVSKFHNNHRVEQDMRVFISQLGHNPLLIWYVFAFWSLQLFMTYKNISCTITRDANLIRHNVNSWYSSLKVSATTYNMYVLLICIG